MRYSKLPCAQSRVHFWSIYIFFSFPVSKNSRNILFLIFNCKKKNKKTKTSQIFSYLRLIGNRTACRPVRSVIILVIKQVMYDYCLVPVRRFPSPSRSIHFGDLSEANGRETSRQKQNAHVVDVVNSRKKTFVGICGIDFSRPTLKSHHSNWTIWVCSS